MSDTAPARDRFRWAILALVSVSHVIGASAQYGINTLAPFYQDELGLSRAQVGLFFSAFYLAMTGASFVAGWLADRLGVRNTTLQGHLIVGVCTVAASLAPSFAWAFAWFFLCGLGYAFLNPASTKGVMAWFYRDERATAMGIKQTGVPTGGFVTALVAPPLVLLVGWRGAFVALGVINFFFGFVFSYLWREPFNGAEPGVVKQQAQTPVHTTAQCRRFFTGKLRHGDFSDRADGADHLRAALSERVDGILALLGEPGAGDRPRRRDGWPGRLGRGQRPDLRRPAQDRAGHHRPVEHRADDRIELHDQAVIDPFTVGDRFSVRSLHRRLSRRFLRSDRRARRHNPNRRRRWG